VSENIVGRSCFRHSAHELRHISADVHGRMPPSRVIVTHLVTHGGSQASRTYAKLARILGVMCAVAGRCLWRFAVAVINRSAAWGAADVGLTSH
jgi:hypothetical protein